MTIYSLYVYDRHCTCVYYQDWHRTTRPRPALEGGILPAVSAAISPRSKDKDKDDSQTEDGLSSTYGSPRNTLRSSTGIVIAVNEEAPSPPRVAAAATAPPSSTQGSGQGQGQSSSTSLTFDEEAKLVYGVVLSLRSMIKKLSGRDEQFTSYCTSSYKLHLFETLSGYKFVMLSDPSTDSLRFVLRQIYAGPFLEYVVRNPLVVMDSRERGVDNEYFRTSVDRMVRGLTVFQ